MSLLVDSEKTVEVRGVKLRRDPAREGCFSVVHGQGEMPVANIGTAEARREFLHRDVNNELQSLEIAAQNLADFPEAPWGLRMELARQCWDETRHARLCYRRLREMGGYKGEFPILNQEWGVVCSVNSLPARLAIQNRAFEGGSLDVFRKMVRLWEEAGDSRTSEIMDVILHDEVHHVRFGNQWLRQMSKENPRVLLDVATAMNHVESVIAALEPTEGEVNVEGVDLSTVTREIETSTQDRELADFSEREISELTRRTGETP
jgi:uncharacterized ferritin-like protein (DUF455 family)